MLRCLIYWCFTSYFKGVNYYILGRSAYYRIGTQLFEYLIIYGEQWITWNIRILQQHNHLFVSLCLSFNQYGSCQKWIPMVGGWRIRRSPLLLLHLQLASVSVTKCPGTSKDGRYQDHDWRDSDGYVEDLLFIFLRNQGQDDGVVVAKALVVELSAAIIGTPLIVIARQS